MTNDEIHRRFSHHPPSPATAVSHSEVRVAYIEFVEKLNKLMPTEDVRGTRELSLMFTALEEASFWAQAHIARDS